AGRSLPPRGSSRPRPSPSSSSTTTSTSRRDGCRHGSAAGSPGTTACARSPAISARTTSSGFASASAGPAAATGARWRTTCSLRSSRRPTSRDWSRTLPTRSSRCSGRASRPRSSASTRRAIGDPRERRRRSANPALMAAEPNYRPDLALVHHLGFGFHADLCAPGVLALLEPVRARRGLVVELGCGSGLLTRHLVEAGHRVLATDASPAMLELARTTAPDAEVRRLALPDDAIPECDAVVSTGHVLNYLPDEPSLDRALTAAARALRPGGVLALDVCDLRWGEARRGSPSYSRVEDDWAIVTRFSLPRRDLFVREITTLLRARDGTWRRSDERHENVLTDTSRLPELLGDEGVDAEVRPAFGAE